MSQMVGIPECFENKCGRVCDELIEYVNLSGRFYCKTHVEGNSFKLGGIIAFVPRVERGIRKLREETIW